MIDFLTPAGALFGPDFVIVTVNDDTGVAYSLQVYPDANNQALRAAGQPVQYYWQPAQVYLAKKQDSPQDFAFGFTLFKGLLTSETDIGVTGDVEAGGGFCTFTTTFAVPDSVIVNAVKALKTGSYGSVPPRLGGLFYSLAATEPDPELGMITVLEDDVSIYVPPLGQASGPQAPMYIDAQTQAKGSIEEHGYNSFLVTCSELAAGAIVGSLQAGMSPFVINCTLKEQMAISGVRVTVSVDFQKAYAAVSAAVSVSGFFGLTNASLSLAYSNMVTNGAIITDMQMDESALPEDLKQWVMKYVDDMQTTAFNAIKDEIFDWKPTAQTPATASSGGGLLGSIFGGASVSLKASYQGTGLSMTQILNLDTTIAVDQAVSGTLDDLSAAVKADPGKYIAVVDIGEYFQKIQVAGTCGVNFSEVLPDGTNLSDPIESVALQVSYPSFDAPLSGNQPNLVAEAQGLRYTIGQAQPGGPEQLAIWTKANSADVVNLSFLRLANDLPGWPANQVQLTATLVFDGSDPRVELADGTSTAVRQYVTQDHAPTLTADLVGYVFVRFMLDRILPTDNITLTLTLHLGSRTDTRTITQANQANVLWQIFSDKYENATSFSYDLSVEVTGPDFTDSPVTWQTPAPVTVPLPTGRVKYLDPLLLPLPPCPPDQIATVNRYITAVKQQASS
jgi:hypothetical protein